jgi:hypothetical protein
LKIDHIIIISNKNPRPSPSGSPWGWSLSEAFKPQGSFELGGNLFPKKYLKKKRKEKKKRKKGFGRGGVSRTWAPEALFCFFCRLGGGGGFPRASLYSQERPRRLLV